MKHAQLNQCIIIILLVTVIMFLVIVVVVEVVVVVVVVVVIVVVGLVVVVSSLVFLMITEALVLQDRLQIFDHHRGPVRMVNCWCITVSKSADDSVVIS